MGVKELGKPYASKCQHQCPTGCGIYGQHPASCKIFQCGWKLYHDQLPEDSRPDKSGVLFAVDNLVSNEPTMIVYEAKPQAIMGMPMALKEFVEWQATIRPVVLVKHGDRLGTAYKIAAEYPERGQGSYQHPGTVRPIAPNVFSFVPEKEPNQ